MPHCGYTRVIQVNEKDIVGRKVSGMIGINLLVKVAVKWKGTPCTPGKIPGWQVEVAIIYGDFS
jgi:hypothetical protein